MIYLLRRGIFFVRILFNLFIWLIWWVLCFSNLSLIEFVEFLVDGTKKTFYISSYVKCKSEIIFILVSIWDIINAFQPNPNLIKTHLMWLTFLKQKLQNWFLFSWWVFLGFPEETYFLLQIIVLLFKLSILMCHLCFCMFILTDLI